MSQIHYTKKTSEVRIQDQRSLDSCDGSPTTFPEHEIPDKYSEAWYDLGSPIQIPSIKFLILLLQYALDNFFFVKNTYNALVESEDGSHAPKIVAISNLALHVISSILISIIDSLNKDAIRGQKAKYFRRKNKLYIVFRMLAHLTLTMKLFRHTVGYLENRRRNEGLHKLRMRRTKLSGREIQYVVDQKKNQLVESHYDLVESFFKTVPAALLQVFFMFQTNPDARLRLYSTTDQDRFATVFFTIITASISTANYQCDYLSFKKVLHFQDSFQSKFQHDINLVIPGDLFLITNIPVQILTIGIRICFYSVLIFWSPYQFLITLGIILGINWFLTLTWNPTTWRFRPVLENPLFGIPWLCFDIIDLWINLFVPGVHYPKPLDHLLNFYTTLITGIVIFRGFDFLIPGETKDVPRVFLDANHNQSDFAHNWDYFSNITAENNSTSTSKFDKDSRFLIRKVIEYLILVHEYLTLNQMSYSSFFYNVVKFMNIINFICFCYTCFMNFLKVYDLDFPIQTVNSFYKSLLTSLNSDRSKNSSTDPLLSKWRMRDKAFLVVSLLPNSKFFHNMGIIKNWRWDFFDDEMMNELIDDLIKDGTSEPSAFSAKVRKVVKVISPILYPASFREPHFDWDISIEKASILSSLNNHPLREEIAIFVNDFYENADDKEKLLLAVFCENYEEIVRHYTSLRLKRMFPFFQIEIVKYDLSREVRMLRRDDNRKWLKPDYEMNYAERFYRAARAKGKEINAFIL